jgi:hypothetical protein
MAQQLPGAYPEHLRCFLHVPKSGGTSVYEALRSALPHASLSVKSNDTSTFCYGFTAFEALGREARESLLIEERELDALSRSDIVFGHFSLPTLLRVAPLPSIATVLREPRARLLSLYVWGRLTPGLFEMWKPYPPEADVRRPLDEYLSEPQIAPEVDNVVCRMLLYGDPRIPPLDFISPDHIERLAWDAIDRLDQLGFVGVLERSQATWEGLSRFFGVRLNPTRARVTASAGIVADALPVQAPISERTLDLLDARTAADTLVYIHTLEAGRTDGRVEQIRNSAFAAQLVKLGDLGGSSAASAQSLTCRIADAESQLVGLAHELNTCQEELRRHRMWLAGIQGSLSWRITAPLRAAKRHVLGVTSSWRRKPEVPRRS